MTLFHDKETGLLVWGRRAAWLMAMAAINLLFSELYFLNSGYSWKFRVSLILSGVSLVLMWGSTMMMKEYELLEDEEKNKDF
jgi:ABC-type sulfate transport system permease subunit